MRFTAILLLFFVCKVSARADAKQEGERLFSLKVRSILSSKCFACHGEDAKKIKGELDLTSRAGLLKGGESEEPSLNPEKPLKSPLYLAATREHEDDWSVMPPKENDKLSVTQLSVLKRWVELGAPWPDAKTQARYIAEERAKPVTSATPQTRQTVMGTAGSLQDPRWCEGLGLLQERDLSWDLRVPAWHLEEAAMTLQHFPALRVILNHSGLPWDRSPRGIAQWREGLQALSENPHVAVKLSELGSPWYAWDASANRELLCEVLDIFGTERCLFASNFPVSGLRVSYGDWLSLVTSAINEMTTPDMRQTTFDKILHDNAIHWYRLSLADTPR
mgnify:CR=1 FL=1